LQVLGFSGGERRWDFLPQRVILETAVALSSIPRWKSQRSKIHRLAYRFSIELSLLGLAYGFLRDCGCFELHPEVEITKKQNP
jgi:hypothetical protein